MVDNQSLFTTTEFWRNKKVMVTGGAGFLGRHLVERLREAKADIVVPRKSQYNFTSMEMALKCLTLHRPDIVIHSAAYYGGLGITLNEPAKIYYENLVMGAHLMEAARLCEVKKLVTVGTACSYPGHLDNSLKESDLWRGPLHDSVLAYGSTKKMLAIQGMAYKRQYNFDSIHLIPSNLYGPYDCYDDYRSHVIGALIKRFCDAHERAEDVSVWGSGKPIREFLFVEDCADGILLAAEKYNDISPLNIGNGVGTSIRQLVETIVDCLNFRGKVHWDSAKPDGQLVKILDISKMKSALGWQPRTELQQGIQKSIQWYQHHYLKTSNTVTELRAARA